jgi:FdrA protein
MPIKARVKRNAYFDSITLMKIARSLTEMAGVEDAAAIMATEPNLQLLAEAGLTPLEPLSGIAGPADVLLVVRAGDEASAEAALEAAEAQLSQRPSTSAEAGEAGAVAGPKQPRSLEQAVQQHPERGQTGLAVISVPGPYAALESERALRAGLHVFLFSDNVPLKDEIALKRLAQERNLLLMGPDCGTAMLNGVGFGFVNVVPPGPIGIVGASGTGIQQVMSLIAQRDGGVSQVIGCGGRDLSEEVGAITTLQGLRMLQEDKQTQVIVLISKPPAPAVAERVLEAAAISNKPVIVSFVRADADALQQRYGSRLTITHNLTEAAHAALASIDIMSDKFVGYAVFGDERKQRKTRTETRSSTEVQIVANIAPVKADGYLAGLFSGGTLCDEAMHVWSEHLGPVYSNIPLKPEWRLSEGQAGRQQGHIAIDFGADEYTRGRPHPMIDPSLRLKRLQEEARNPHVRVILLDIVLGYCSYPDPASVYAPAIRAARAQAALESRPLTCVISLCGTEGDPQRLSTQAAQFREAGAEVFTSNVEAALRCIDLLGENYD